MKLDKITHSNSALMLTLIKGLSEVFLHPKPLLFTTNDFQPPTKPQVHTTSILASLCLSKRFKTQKKVSYLTTWRVVPSMA